MESLSGSDNITNIEACFTRLRSELIQAQSYVLKDLWALPGVKDVIIRGNEIHLVIGMEVTNICTQCQQFLKEKHC